MSAKLLSLLSWIGSIGLIEFIGDWDMLENRISLILILFAYDMLSLSASSFSPPSPCMTDRCLVPFDEATTATSSTSVSRFFCKLVLLFCIIDGFSVNVKQLIPGSEFSLL